MTEEKMILNDGQYGKFTISWSTITLQCVSRFSQKTKHC